MMNEQSEQASSNLPPDRPKLKPHSATREMLRGVLSGVGTAIVAGGAIFALLTVQPSTSRGSTRSAKLRWQERQAQIDQAIAQQQQAATQKPDGHVDHS